MTGAPRCSVVGCPCWVRDGNEFDDEPICWVHHRRMRTWARMVRQGAKGPEHCPLVRQGGAIVENTQYDLRLAGNGGGRKPGGLDLGKARDIRERNIAGETVKSIAAEKGVSESTIARVLARELWPEEAL